MQYDSLQALKIATLSGNRIDAIKLYRTLFGVGLAEAKSAIEHLAVVLRSESLKDPPEPFLPAGHPPMPEPVLAQIRMCLFGGQKIAAIKFYREHNPVGLAEAKAAIDRMEDMLRAQSPGLFVQRPRFFTGGHLGTLIGLANLIFVLWLVIRDHLHR